MPKTLDELLDEAELAQLQAHYGEYRQQHVRLAMEPGSLAFYRRAFKNRRGEVLFVLRRGSGEVLLHTKESYPEDLYRLPGGGIDWGECVRTSLFREVFEETQLDVQKEQFLGILTYEFHGHPGADQKAAIPFVSYIFVVPEVEGEPVPLDESEKISGFKWVPLEELSQVAAKLRSMPEDDFGNPDWGRFRALGHNFVVENIG